MGSPCPVGAIPAPDRSEGLRQQFEQGERAGGPESAKSPPEGPPNHPLETGSKIGADRGGLERGKSREPHSPFNPNAGNQLRARGPDLICATELFSVHAQIFGRLSIGAVRFSIRVLT